MSQDTAKAKRRDYAKQYAQTPHGKEVIRGVQQRRRARLQEERRRAEQFLPPPQFKQQFEYLKWLQDQRASKQYYVLALSVEESWVGGRAVDRDRL